MKRFISSFIGRLRNGIKQGFSAYVKTFSDEDPRSTLYIFGWLKKIGGGLWNGVKGAIGGFFGGGGAVTVTGAPPKTGAPIIITEPREDEDEKKPNIILYVGIGVGVIMLVIVLMMVLRRR